MKFIPQHYEHLKECVSLAVQKATAETGNSFTQMKEKHLAEYNSEQRFRWDLFWLSKWSTFYPTEYNLYEDAHIETALKNIVKEFN